MMRPVARRRGIVYLVMGGSLLLGLALLVERGFPRKPAAKAVAAISPVSPSLQLIPRGTQSPTSAVVPAAAKRDVAARDVTAKKKDDWLNEMSHSDDMYASISHALPSALQGDGRAAWSISEAMGRCAGVNAIFHGATDPATLRVLEVERGHMSPNNPQWIHDVNDEMAKMCSKLATTDPFAALPPRAGGYTITYWRKLALAEGDGLAVVEAATTSVAVGIDWSKELTPAEIETLQTSQAKLQAAVSSADPAVLFRVGMNLTDGQIAVDIRDGVALALAGCEMGFDCSANNPMLPWHNCQYSGECPANADFKYFMQTTGLASQYGEVYQHALEIEQGLQQGDSSAAAAAVRLRIPAQQSQ